MYNKAGVFMWFDCMLQVLQRHVVWKLMMFMMLKLIMMSVFLRVKSQLSSQELYVFICVCWRCGRPIDLLKHVVLRGRQKLGM